jgi:hypothetical protein
MQGSFVLVHAVKLAWHNLHPRIVAEELTLPVYESPVKTIPNPTPGQTHLNLLVFGIFGSRRARPSREVPS